MVNHISQFAVIPIVFFFKSLWSHSAAVIYLYRIPQHFFVKYERQLHEFRFFSFEELCHPICDLTIDTFRLNQTNWLQVVFVYIIHTIIRTTPVISDEKDKCRKNEKHDDDDDVMCLRICATWSSEMRWQRKKSWLSKKINCIFITLLI